MLDSHQCVEWQRAELEILLESGLASPEILILKKHPSSEPKKKSLLSKIGKWIKDERLFYRIYNDKMLTPALKSYRRSSLPDALSGVEEIVVSPIRKGKYSEYFSESDIDLLKSKDLDFIIRFGFGIIRGDTPCIQIRSLVFPSRRCI